MQMKVMAVFDVQAQAFQRPIFVAAEGVAIRMCTDAVNRPAPNGEPNDLYSHTKDFRLFDLGEYDDQTGQFSCKGLPRLVVDLIALKDVQGDR